MKIKLNVGLAKMLEKEHGLKSNALKNNYDYYNDDRFVTIDHTDLSPEYLVGLEKWANDNKEEPFANGFLQIFSMLKSISNDVGGKFPKRLDGLEEATIQWIAKDFKNFFLYTVSSTGFFLPYLVTSVRYYPKEDKDRPAFVAVNLKYVRYNRSETTTITFYTSDLAGYSTIRELFQSKGYYHEDDNMNDKYVEQIAKYREICKHYGHQYIAKGVGKEEGTYSSAKISMLRDGVPTKVVQDYDFKQLESVHSDMSFWKWCYEDKDADRSIIIPVHPFVKVFDLQVHKNMWLHVDDMEKYVYNPKLIDLLILPPEIKEIVGILSTNVGNNMGDIVAGKSAGVFMLLKGLPGVGKTLCAEVYSEVIGKPLYSVQSAQLGVEPLKLESNLKEILTRAQAWNAVLLIDECDVYMKQRGDDLVQNAVVGIWLRTLEYYRGMLICTTNKETAIDEAILSRARAIVHFPVPQPENARVIWKNLIAKNEIDMGDKLIDYCITRFPRITGRSIKNIIELVRLLAAGKKSNKITEEMIERAAIYTYINGEEKTVTNE